MRLNKKALKGIRLVIFTLCLSATLTACKILDTDPGEILSSTAVSSKAESSMTLSSEESTVLSSEESITLSSEASSELSSSKPKKITAHPANSSDNSSDKPTSPKKQKKKPGFSWDSGGNYTGSISIPVAETTKHQESGGGVTVDTGNSSQGYILVKKAHGAKTKVRVVGPSGKIYQRYILPAAGKFCPIPLQMGDGRYTVSVWEQAGGNKYRKLLETTFSASCKGRYALRPGIYANYTASSTAVRKGFGLCMNSKTDLDKVKSVYNYIIRNISYDDAKLNSVQASYVPNPDQTLSSKKGICFDYACLMATMLRAQGISTRIVFGYAGRDFHAWNEVYIQNKGWIAVGIPSDGGWKRLDSTFGTTLAPDYLENNQNYSSVEYY